MCWVAEPQAQSGDCGESGGKRSENGGKRSENGGQRSENGGQHSETCERGGNDSGVTHQVGKERAGV